MDEEAFLRDIRLAFPYSYDKDDWVFPLRDALSGVTVAEALWKPVTTDPDPRCLWQIVLHMAVWNENIVQRMADRRSGERPGRPSDGDWPALPDTPDSAAWDAAQQRLWDSLTSVGGHLETVTAEELLDYGTAGYSQFDDLLCRFFHMAYHIGQITKLRDWYAAQSTTH